MRIFVDWGSTNFRAFLMDGERAIDQLENPGRGVLAMFDHQSDTSRAEAFSSFLANELSSWLHNYQACPILMCGAIGSREGWVDTGYTQAPASLEKIAANIHRIASDNPRLETHPLYIIPGLTAGTPGQGRVDIMRSEDVKSFGAAAIAGLNDALLCVPGTHCKWVKIEDKVITNFRSILTGELFGLLQKHGSLAAMFDEQAPADDPESFNRGIEVARDGDVLSADLFQLRSQIIRGVEIASPASFLSGILIGHEMRWAKNLYPDSRDVILLTGSGPREVQYRRALTQFGWDIKAVVPSEAAVCIGLESVRKAAGI